MITELKKDLLDASLSDSDILNKYILCGDPFIFSGNVGLYASLKSKIAQHFTIDITKVHMVGSAKLGFSIARPKLWKPFNDESDIDMVVVSENVFDRLWEEISDLNISLYDRSEQDDQKFNSFLKYFFRGWIRPDLLPLRYHKTQMWFEYFRSISYKEFGSYKITGAIFRNEFFFRKYHETNINIIRKGVEHA